MSRPWMKANKDFCSIKPDEVEDSLHQYFSSSIFLSIGKNMSKPYYVVLLIFLLTTTPSSYSDNQTDFEALVAFKKAIQDGPLGALSSWNEATHFCRWNGITCSKKHRDRVVSVSMPSQGLVGTLSPYVGNLSFLRLINLQNNTFRGPIPEEMGRLKRVESITFSNNSFEGGIPRNLSQCRNLYLLNLINNNLIGPIIPEIGSLVNLEGLGLATNMLSGTIPPFLGNLTSLRKLSLSICGLQGDIPESLGQLGRLFFLNLGLNRLTGGIPLHLYNLSSMQTLVLSFNQLHGTVLSDIGFKFPKLKNLGLSENHFTGPLPASLSNCSLIEQIYVYSNDFNGEMIDSTKLSALKILRVEYNHLKGDMGIILSSLTNCTGLVNLAMHFNLFTGLLPDFIGNLSTHLEFLSMSEKQLWGRIPSTIGNLVNLAVLIIEDTKIDGPIPRSIGELNKLQEIYLGGNRLANEMPSSLGNLTALNKLFIQRNNLSGNIPASLGNCSNLLWLDLGENNLDGSIPPQIMRLSSISILFNLSHNLLTGSIPPEVGSLTNLGFLDLSNNRLSGTVPSSLSSCVILEVLYLRRNYLLGEIPDSLRALRGLVELDLSQNNFSGTIPRFLGELRLEYLNLSFNALQGEVPTRGVFQNETAFSLEGNDGLCGGITVLGLPDCPSTDSSKKDFGKISKILISTAGGIFLMACFCIIIYRRRKSQRIQSSVAIFRPPEFLRLSYADLLNATSGFSETNLVGAGRFGSVYKGVLNDDECTTVAVKVVNLEERGACKSLETECSALRGIRHRNLLKILSVCDSIDFQGGDFKALVYEFMANGSLENWLHQDSEEEGRILSIIQRLNIAIDVASAVEYLHCGTDSTVIHGDLKPSNILLDEDMVAHVGDFGLAKIISNISENLSTTGSSSSAIKGTIGYIAPEYGMNSVVSTQGDAYSYGILLLEMFTNRRPTSDALEGRVNLHDFVSNVLPDRVMEAVDPFLHREINRNGHKYQTCIVSVLSIGVRCSKQLPRDRMSIAEALNELKKIRNVFVASNNCARN